MAKRQPKEKMLLNIPVSFRNVSIGDGTAGIPVRIDRTDLNPSAADDLLCGRRLQAKIAVGNRNEDPDQKHLWDDLHHKLEAAFESKGYSVRPKYLKATLNVCLNDIDVEELAHFAKTGGRMIVESVAVLEEDGKEGEED